MSTVDEFRSDSEDEAEQPVAAKTPAWVQKLDSKNLPFNLFFCGMIVLNGGNMALAIHYDDDEAIQRSCQIFEHVFTVVFTLELLLRGYFEKPRNIVFDPWNLFDLVLLIIAYSEMILMTFSSGEGYMSWFRIFRIIRLFRIVKLIPGIRAVVVALLKSASKMVKVAGLVLLFVLATALFLAEAIGNNERFNGWEGQQLNFGTIGRSALTMVRVTTLDGWSDLAEPIYDVSASMALFMVFYVTISAFALMNVFVAVITDAVITEKGKQDQDILHGRVLGHEKLLKELFNTCTALTNEQEISRNAFRAFLRSMLEDPAILGVLTKMAAEYGNVFPQLEEVQRIFEAMDMDGNGSFSEQEFVDGMLFCMRSRPIDNGRRFVMLQTQLEHQQRALVRLSSDVSLILEKVGGRPPLENGQLAGESERSRT
jgi:voltage-gated sodium channel